ncbi:MAG TPA: ATP-dependent 6-phosphofructokinase, partial [Pirellulaceae bacterium]|nr:ATP-dependent 6-phosphofructokinase [Pirellulaceae bacterium]
SFSKSKVDIGEANMSGTQRRIGILTSGGDAPGLNAVIRGAVKAATRHGYEVIGFHRGYEGLAQPVSYSTLTYKSTAGILALGGTIIGTTNRGRFTAKVGKDDRVSIDPELIDEVKTTCRQLALEGLICVGGDGSLSIGLQLYGAGVPVVGVPKTIDNDLSATAFTFGFDSAVACVTDALDRLHTTAASHDRIFVLEVMGRHAGWIALYAGIAGGGDVILIPEIPWTFENVCQKVVERDRAGKRFTLIVVAEGAELPGKGLVTAEAASAQGQTRLGGIGDIVAAEVERRLGRETRVVVLGHLQRGGQPTAFDRALATQFGAHAVRLVVQRRFGEMVCYEPPHINSVPIEKAVAKLSRVDINGSTVQAARAMGISFGEAQSDVGPFELTSSGS